MSETKVQHTPGPWQVKECGSPDCWCRVIVADSPDVVDADGHGDHVVISAGSLRSHNASLIAAAPELLVALEMLLDWHVSEHPEDEEFSAVQVARAALSKATGSAS